jgi:LacI family transcriptional regulator
MKFDRPKILLLTSFDTSYFREMFRGIVAYSHQHTHWHLLSRTNLTSHELRKINPAGVLVTSVRPQVNQWIRAAGIPYIIMGDISSDPNDSSVCADDAAIGAMAVEYFASLGLKHLAFVAHSDWPFVGRRMESFIKAAEARGYGRVHHMVGTARNPDQQDQFVQDLETMLTSLPRPCGVLTANDAAGVMVVEACRRIDLRVPDDIAVLGVDNDQLECELSEVPLSSVFQPAYAIGYESAALLHQQLQQPGKPPSQLLLPPVRIVPRASSDLIALDDEDVVAALKLINHHMAEPINVNWVVRQIPVARRSLYRKFTALVGRTLLEQIHFVRFQRAKELLQASTRSRSSAGSSPPGG